MACKILLHLFIAALLIQEGKSWELPSISGALNSLFGKSKEAAKAAKAAATESVQSATDAAHQAVQNTRDKVASAKAKVAEAKAAAAESVQSARDAARQAVQNTRDKVASAKAKVIEAKDNAKKVMGLTIDFAKKSARDPSAEVLAMLDEEGYKRRKADSSCARAGVSIRCVVWNAAITIDTHSDPETGVIKVRLAIYTPGLPPVTKDLTDDETNIPLPGLAMQVPKLADLGMFLKVKASHDDDGKLNINVAVTACAKLKLIGLKPCLPSTDILAIADGKIVMAAKIQAVTQAFAKTPGLAAGFLKSTRSQIHKLNPLGAKGDSAEDKKEL